MNPLRFLVFPWLLTFSSLPALAQLPDTLKHSIPGPLPVARQNGAELGASVAIDGGLTVAGAPFDDIAAFNSGAVKVFDTATGEVLHVLANPSQRTSDFFGQSVAISGTRVVVGVRGDDTGASAAGRAEVYDLASATPTVPVLTLTNPDPAVDDFFGDRVAISGTRVVIGAQGDDAGASNAGSAYVYDLAGATPAVPIATLNNPAPAADDRFGFSVAISGARVVIGADGDDPGVTNAGSAYVYDLNSATPTVPTVTIAKPVGQLGDAFGNSVAIDATRVVVGAWLDDTGAVDAGSAYVYDVASATPAVPIFTLSNPEPAAGDFFGSGVAISGTRVVVGAQRDDADASDAGRGYVYDLAGATPLVPVFTLNDPTPAASDNFGCAVALSGTRAVVGARTDDAGANDAGSAYVYHLVSATPAQPAATLNDPGLAVGDEFGSAVAVAGTWVVVGAHLDDTAGIDAGSIHLYDLASAAPSVPAATILNPVPTGQGQFGTSVDMSGTRVVVGAPEDDSTASNAGRAYVYDLASGTPAVPVFTLENPSPLADDRFGRAVAISGTRVVVGVSGYGPFDYGRAYVYDLAGATPTVPIATLNNPSPGSFDTFGGSVAIAGSRVVIGASLDDTNGTDAGSAYVYDLAGPTPTAPMATLNNPEPAAGDLFGVSVAISGTRAVVGANFDDFGEASAGSVYVYDLASATPTVPVVTLRNPSPAIGDLFGSSVAIQGTRVLVSAAREDVGAVDTGGAYLYNLASATPDVPVAVLGNPSPAANDLFFKIAFDGYTAVVGTPFDDTTITDKGAAYVFAPADNDADDDGLLDLWEYARFGTIVGHSAQDDGDGDGREELLELAFDRDPIVPDASAGPQVVNEGGYLTLTLAKRAGVTYLGQSAATPDEAAFSAATTTVVVNDATTLKVRDNFPITGGGQRFLRMKVMAAP